MPQFVKPPADSPEAGAIYVNTATGGKKPDEPDKPKDPTPTGSGSTPSAPAKLTAAEKKAARAKRIAARKAANAAARAERNNPLLAPYKSPAQLRKEAAELAALSVASEESLRTQQGLQETGLTGLTTALSNRLSGVSNDYAGMLRGLQGSYNTVAGDATSAGETALAAAGAPTSTPVAGANPLMASNFAALGAVPATYAGAAELTGAQLVGGSKAKLQDALIARSNTVSANTAKYLQQLQDTEYLSLTLLRRQRHLFPNRLLQQLLLTREKRNLLLVRLLKSLTRLPFSLLTRA
jgi:hypothetical protein